MVICSFNKNKGKGYRNQDSGKVRTKRTLFPAQAWAGWIAYRNIEGQDGVGRSPRLKN